ncbi:MAG: winged helix-turn-helix domain-containing protein, partial [Pyramidobacter sp.]|nr:winged helix-turn-helix domain-containing protein [Pyramidobacter sp.]
PETVTSTARSRALFFRHEALLERDRTTALLQNVCDALIRIVARKNLALLRVNFLLAQRTIRERALAYLSYRAQDEGVNAFDIPMNRQELADFLAVDRSALSAELSRMRADGLIDFRKNHFELLKKTDCM